jgi:hypothetical protein
VSPRAEVCRPRAPLPGGQRPISLGRGRRSIACGMLPLGALTLGLRRYGGHPGRALAILPIVLGAVVAAWAAYIGADCPLLSDLACPMQVVHAGEVEVTCAFFSQQPHDQIPTFNGSHIARVRSSDTANAGLT